MIRPRVVAALASLCLALAAPTAWAQPASLTMADPPSGLTPAPRMVSLTLQSGGAPMSAVYYLAGGPGPHPVVLLLHGFPGYEQNLDLAQALRRAGWNVLTFHYRGSWGSGGGFSFTHVMEDADVALGFLRNPEAAKTFNADRDRIVVVGHSMGGLAAAGLARRNPALSGVALIDAANMGKAGAPLKLLPGPARKAVAERVFADLGPLTGTSATALADELADHNADFDYLPWAAEMARVPSLVIGATGADGRAKESAPLAEAMRKAGGTVTALQMPTDHSFSDHRVALTAVVLDWLRALPPR